MDGATPGSVEDQSAYCSKLFRLWGIASTLAQLTEQHKLQAGGVHIACDGLSALKQAQHNNPTDPTLVHYNLIGAIWTIKDKLPIKLKFKHVWGHQDSGIMMVLPWSAWTNIKMDELTKHKIDNQAT